MSDQFSDQVVYFISYLNLAAGNQFNRSKNNLGNQLTLFSGFISILKTGIAKKAYKKKIENNKDDLVNSFLQRLFFHGSIIYDSQLLKAEENFQVKTVLIFSSCNLQRNKKLSDSR